MVYTCKEHLEEAIDQFLVETEASPDIEVLVEETKELCFLCKATAEIVLKSFEAKEA